MSGGFLVITMSHPTFGVGVVVEVGLACGIWQQKNIIISSAW